MATKDKLVNLEDLKAVHDVDATAVRDLKNLTVDQGSKNLLWFTNRTNRDINNVKFTFNDDGSVTAVGTASSGINLYMMGDIEPKSTTRLPAGTYTFSRWTVSGTGNIRIRRVDGSTNTDIISSNDTTVLTKTETFESGVRIVLQVGNGVSVNGTFRFQCEAGSTGTDYVPPVFAYDAKARMSIAANTGDISDLQTNAVRSDDQTLTTAQQTKARENIGAGAASDVDTLMGGAVRHDVAQTLGANKVTARDNIGAAGADAIAPEYEQKTYGVGDYVWHEGDLYRCTSAIASAETWTAAHWAAATLADAVSNAIDRSPQRNLFFFRNPTNTTTTSGLTITYNNDGSVTLSGQTSTIVQIAILATAAENLPAGTYTITRWRTSGDGNLRMRNYREGISNPDVVRTSEAFYRTTVTFDSAPSLGLLVPGGSDFGTGATFYYQIEQGSAASPYVKRFGSNVTSITPELAPLQKEYDNEFIKYKYLTRKASEASSENHYSTESIQVLIGGNVRYDLCHADSANESGATKTYNVWHMLTANAAELNGSNFKWKKFLTTGGEWECALRMLGWSDFHGGYAHGFEVMDTNGFAVYADGMRITLADLATRTEVQTARELRIYESSKIKDESNADALEHRREYIFNKNGLTINQSVKWKVSGGIGSCYMAMLPAAKECTSSFASDTGCEMIAFPTESGAEWPTIPKAKKTTIFGNVSGEPLAIEFNIDRYPEGIAGGDMLLTTDNTSPSRPVTTYNKLYYVISSGDSATVAENDVWYTTTHYAFKIGV